MSAARILNLLALVCCCLPPRCALAAHTQARLLLAADHARPGDTLLAGVQLTMEPRWHTYWRNPGASGAATEIKWQLPKGVTAEPIQWPVPEKLTEADLTTYIYTNEVILLVPLKLAADLPPGPLQLKADVSWLECEVQCIPGKAALEATINIGGETKPSSEAATLQAWQAKLPKTGDALVARALWQPSAATNSRPLILEWNSSPPAAQADFFPDASEDFEVQGPTDRLPGGPGTVALRKEATKLQGAWPQRLSGLAVEQSGATRSAYEINCPILSTTDVAGEMLRQTPPASLGAPLSFWKMLLYAFVGGLILNVMPCVLPVIALKILGFVGQAKDEPRQVRKLGLIYTLGILASFLLLAALVIGLKAAGAGVGWGFQFSNPYFLVLMTVLVTLIALNLFGVFEVAVGGRTLDAASSLSSKHGPSGAFFNGLLATVLATSCSAPILAGAVGVAFAQPPAVIILTMLTVGLGLAAPYLVLSWHPAWLRFLPKPGPWMERFKVAMGFPMLAAAVWLCSLLTVHYGERAWWMALFLVFLAAAAWIYGDFVQRGRKRRALAVSISAIILLTGYAYAVEAKLRWRTPIQDAPASRLASEAPQGIDWQEWTPEAPAQARAQGRPVLVDFTAKWCLTCNAVIKPALENPAVQQKLKEINALPLLANYTRQPPSITAELARFGRAGVPLVVIYPRNPQSPPMVFDLVTSGTVLDALDRAAQ